MAEGNWLEQDSRRMLHAVYRVGDLQKTIDAYRDQFGMQMTRYIDVPEKKYTIAFMSYGPETDHFAVELTYNYGVDSYDLGEGFGHFAIYTPDAYKTCEEIKQHGGKIVREAGPVKGGSTVIAFAQDLTGYKWEIIERDPVKERLCQVMLRVGDLERSIKFYTDVLGMKLLRKRDNPDYKYTLAFLGYTTEDEGPVMELTYNWGQTEYAKGDAYAHVALATNDVFKTAEQIEAAGGTVTRAPGPVQEFGTKIVATTDPDGWKFVFVDNQDFLKELEK